MIRIYILPVLTFLLTNCTGQIIQKDEGTELIDPVLQGTPFLLKRDKIYLDLSSKTDLSQVEGIVAVSITIDSTEQLSDFKILKLRIESGDTVLVNFLNSSPKLDKDYPENVKNYLPIISEYVNGIEFYRDKNVPLKEKNTLNFIAKFK